LAWALYSIGNQDETYNLAKEGRDVIQEVLGKKHEAYLGADKLIKKIRRGMHRYGNELTVPDSTQRPPSPEHERNSRCTFVSKLAFNFLIDSLISRRWYSCHLPFHPMNIAR
jgi:hypothetical protein